MPKLESADWTGRCIVPLAIARATRTSPEYGSRAPSGICAVAAKVSDNIVVTIRNPRTKRALVVMSSPQNFFEIERTNRLRIVFGKGLLVNVKDLAHCIPLCVLCLSSYPEDSLHSSGSLRDWPPESF